MGRLAWADGLRGLAALQVVTLHFSHAFLPAIGFLDPSIIHYHWETYFINTPLFLLFDGYSAVFIFFALSGMVLTYSFSANPLRVTTSALKRLVRLGGPMVASMTFAACLAALVPLLFSYEYTTSNGMSGMSTLAPHHLPFKDILHQIGFEGLLTGFSGLSFIPSFLMTNITLVPTTATYNGPLWTLHVELVGSLLIIALVALRALTGPRLHAVACLAVAAVFATSPMLLFVVGHMAAPYLPRLATNRRSYLLGIPLFTVGILLCTIKYPEPAKFILRFLPPAVLGPTAGSVNFTNMIGAICIFFGIAALPTIRHWLERPLPLWIGQVSFSLYLTHFPILTTVVAAVFAALAGSFSYGAAAAISTVIGLAACLAVAAAFERIIDRPIITLSRMIGRTAKARSQKPILSP